MTSSKPAADSPPRNAGTDLRPEWLGALEHAADHADERARGLAGAFGHGPETRNLLMLAVRLLDLTSLGESDDDESVRQLCARAIHPLGTDQTSHVAAVCVWDRFVATARRALDGHAVRTAAVAGGFPVAHPRLDDRVAAVRDAVADGAHEIDLVIDRRLARAGEWARLYDELRALREACGPASLKVILAAGDLGPLRSVASAALVSCMAGADFIKTSTGREVVNATLPVGSVMAGAIRAYLDRSGYVVGIKPAGGIRTAEQALGWIALVERELGPDWLTPDRFRIGASSLLDDLRERLLEAGRG